MDYIDCELKINNETDAEYSGTYFGKDYSIKGKINCTRFLERAVKRYDQWIRNSKECTREDLETLGWHLYNIAFGSPTGVHQDEGRIREAFEANYDRFEEDRKENPDLRLRLKLTFASTVEKLADYPWEFLFKPQQPWGDNGFFLAGERTELILTRHVPEAATVKTLAPTENTLKILVVFSQPTGRKWGTVVDDVSDEIRKLQSNKEIQVLVEKLEEPATPSALRCKVNDFRPHIVHFIGHGVGGMLVLLKDQETLNQERARNVALKNDGKKELPITNAYPVDGKTLRGLLIPKDSPQEPPRLVFLQACEGAVGNSVEALRSVARELIGAKIPCVVAMQYEITNANATLFATTFYEQIGRGRAIDEAVTEARYALGERTQFPRGAWNDPSFGTPVLYLQSNNAVLFPQRGKELPPQPVPDIVPVSEKERCPYPDNCKGWVKPDSKYCITCKRPLMQCDRCNHIMPAQSPYKMCEKCGWPEVTAAAPKPEGIAAAPKPEGIAAAPKPDYIGLPSLPYDAPKVDK